MESAFARKILVLATNQSKPAAGRSVGMNGAKFDYDARV